MRWKAETFEEKRRRLETWRPWFAYKPVVIDGERVWFEWIYRRTKIHVGSLGAFEEIEYADTMSILKKEKVMKDYDGLE